MAEISLMEGNYQRINSYRSVAGLGNILIDVGTRDNGGEAHLVLLVKADRLGFLTVHDKYASGLAPMFCSPHPKAIERFTKRIAESIYWSSPQGMYEYLKDEETLWNNHPMWERNREVCLGFLSDVGCFLRERCSVTN